MLNPKKIFNVVLCIGIVASIVLSLFYYDQYKKEVKIGTIYTFPEFFVKELLSVNNNLQTSENSGSDTLKIVELKNIADAVDAYNIDKGYYPKKITDLKGDYIKNFDKTINDPSFFYHSYQDKFDIGIFFKNGSMYSIAR